MQAEESQRTPASVSVVIPTHNRPALLEAALGSVLAEPEVLEVIVIDDGSVPQVAATGLVADPRVTLIRNETALGPSRARNAGLDAARGTFVGFLDDDDRWLPGKLARSLDVAASHPAAGVVVHRVGDRGEDRPARPPQFLGEPGPYFGTHQTPHLDGIVVRREIADQVRFPSDLEAAEDVDFVLELAKRTPFVLVDEVLAVHGSDDVPSAIGVEKRIAARLALLDRHRDVLYGDPEARAFFHVRLGHLQRHVDRRAAIGSFLRALRHAPTSGLAWRGLAAAVLPASETRRLLASR